MDLLQKELQRKKAALERAKQEAALDDGNNGDNKKKTSGGSKKFLRVGDLRRIQEEQEEEERRKKQEQKLLMEQQRKRRPSSDEQQQDSNEDPDVVTAKQKKKKKKKKRRIEGDSGDGKTSPTVRQDGQPDFKQDGSSKASQSATIASSKQAEYDMMMQFRQLGLPIRLFGETYKERVRRLEQALQEQTMFLQGASEMDEFRLGRGHGIRNPFLEKDKEEDTSNQHSKTVKGEVGSKDIAKDKDAGGATKRDTTTTSVATGTRGNEDAAGMDNADEGGDDENDHPKRIYHFFKGLLKQWEEDLSLRPDHIKRSVAGKNESKTVKQCKDYIRPLFKLCKTRRLEPGMEAHLIKIVNFAQQGEFVSAHDAYIDVAIGRAAWPIGVTMVGIHARSGRAKIESANVAHVMNSELQRKYLTSVKRLLTYAQKKRDDVDPSKKVL